MTVSQTLITGSQPVSPDQILRRQQGTFSLPVFTCKSTQVGCVIKPQGESRSNGDDLFVHVDTSVSSNRTTSSSVTYGHSVRFHARWSRATVRAGLDRHIRRRYEPVQLVVTGPSSSWSVTSRTKQVKISQQAAFLALPLSMFTPSSASSSSFVFLGFLLQIYARDDFQVNARRWDWTVVHEQNTGPFWSN